MFSLMNKEGELGFTLGAHDYLTKPVDRECLVHSLHNAGVDCDGYTVLVVDDDPKSLELTSTTASKLGFRVIEEDA